MYIRCLSTVNVCTANMYRPQNRHVLAVHLCLTGTFTVKGAYVRILQIRPVLIISTLKFMYRRLLFLICDGKMCGFRNKSSTFAVRRGATGEVKTFPNLTHCLYALNAISPFLRRCPPPTVIFSLLVVWIKLCMYLCNDEGRQVSPFK